jgi:hypothetical protein
VNDSEFLRDLAARLENGDDCVRLRRIAMDLERPPTDVIFREANNSEARNMKSFVAGFPVTSVAAIVTEEDPLELTAEMGLARDLDTFMLDYDRDLVAEVRGLLKNAYFNSGVDQLANDTDERIAQELLDYHEGDPDNPFAMVSLDLMQDAVAAVRANPITKEEYDAHKA